MREILFRGKRVDNGEWISGNLFIPNQLVKGCFICSETTFVDFYPSFEDGHNLEDFKINGISLGHFHEIVPETIGQFTGLTDKNGNKIFDGDKFKPDESIEEVKCIVRWDDEFSKFVVDSYGYNFHIGEGSQEVYDNELSIVDTCDLADMILEYCDIIGNIHENK